MRVRVTGNIGFPDGRPVRVRYAARIGMKIETTSADARDPYPDAESVGNCPDLGTPARVSTINVFCAMPLPFVFKMNCIGIRLRCHTKNDAAFFDTGLITLDALFGHAPTD